MARSRLAGSSPGRAGMRRGLSPGRWASPAPSPVPVPLLSLDTFISKVTLTIGIVFLLALLSVC